MTALSAPLEVLEVQGISSGKIMPNSKGPLIGWRPDP